MSESLIPFLAFYSVMSLFAGFATMFGDLKRSSGLEIDSAIASLFLGAFFWPLLTIPAIFEYASCNSK